MREKILNEAIDIIRRKGVHGFSFRTLAERCGIKSSSVHYYFPSKRDLILTILSDYVSLIKTELTALKKNEPEPRRRIEKYIDMFIEWIKDGGYDKGCIALVVGNELSESDKEVRATVSGLVRYHINWLADTIRDGQRAGVFRKDAAPDSFSPFLLLMLEGGSTVSKATCSGDVLKQGGGYAKSLVAQITV